jgi:hypothetical protein
MTITASSTAAPPDRSLLDDPVRRILALDAGFCLVTGTALMASATPIAERTGLAAATVVQSVGGFLVLLGVGLAMLSRSPQRWARLGAAVTGIGDVAWVAASAVLAATAVLPAWATAGVLTQAVLTLAIAGGKWAALRSTIR